MACFIDYVPGSELFEFDGLSILMFALVCTSCLHDLNNGKVVLYNEPEEREEVAHFSHSTEQDMIFICPFCPYFVDGYID